MKHRANVRAPTVTPAMTITSVSLWSRMAPNYMQDLGASKTDIGLAYMLFMVAFRVPQVPGSRPADAWAASGLWSLFPAAAGVPR